MINIECVCGNAVFPNNMCISCLQLAREKYEEKLELVKETISMYENILEEVNICLEHREKQSPEEWDEEMSSKYGPDWRRGLGIADVPRFTVHECEKKTPEGLTMITVTEKDADGNIVCSGCKEVNPNYSQIIYVDETTRKFYSVHKRCSVSNNG